MGNAKLRGAIIGGILVGIEGECDFYGRLVDSIGLKTEIVDGEIDLLIKIVKPRKELDFKEQIRSAKGLMSFNKGNYFVGYLHGLNYVFSKGDSNASPTLTIVPQQDQPFAQKVKAWARTGRANQVESEIQSYALLWWVIHFALSKRGKGFIHAASVVNLETNNATVFGGTGGCGKTSTCMQILSESTDYAYLSEDFSIVGSEGYAYYSPKPVSFHSTDLARDQKISQKIKNVFSCSDRLREFFLHSLLGYNLIHKIEPSAIFPVASEIERYAISSAIYMIRTNVSRPSLVPTPLPELVDRFVLASIRELKTLVELSWLINANDNIGSDFPSSINLTESIRKIYSAAFKDANCYTLLVPFESAPCEIAELVKRHAA